MSKGLYILGGLIGLVAIGGGVYYLYREKRPQKMVGDITWTIISWKDITGRPGDYKIIGITLVRYHLYREGQRLPGVYFNPIAAMAAADRHYKAYVK